MKLQAPGIDLGKTLFHLVGLDSSGQVVVRKRCSFAQTTFAMDHFSLATLRLARLLGSLPAAVHKSRPQSGFGLLASELAAQHRAK
jgi:hypothetical protein